MANIITRSIGTTAINRPLTYAEFDANFININAAISTNASSSYSKTSIIASEGQTTFTATYIVGYVAVYVNGVFLNPQDYTAVNGSTVILIQSVAANSIVEIFSFSTGVDLSINTGSQNIDGGVPGTVYSGILTRIVGGIPSSPLIDSGAPFNSIPPTIIGTAASGQTIQVTIGTWTGTPTPTYSYQWQEYNIDLGYININNATSYSYTITSYNIGSKLRCIVTATNIVSSYYVISSSTATIVQGSGGPVNTALPTITGTTTTGQTLQVTTGTWTGTPTPTYTYQWQKSTDGVNYNNINAINSTYTLVLTDANSTVRCIVTATNTVAIATATTVATMTINTAPVNTALPTITGTKTPGQTIQVTTGTWTGTPTPTYSYQWQKSTDGVNYNNITGATNSTYTLVLTDANSTVRCIVTATNTVAIATATTVATMTINTAPVNTALPTITGTKTPGQTIQVTTGTWTGTPTPTYSYQWQKSTDGVNYNNITGATNSTYTLVLNDGGSTIRCIVTATNTVSAITATTVATTIATITVPDTPTITSVVSYNSTTATISFTAPANNGGAAITSYTVTSNPDGITATGITSPITITGLTVGGSYQFSIYATNFAGNGSVSSTSSATVLTNTTKGIFAFGASAAKSYESATTLVGNSGTLISELSTSNGTARINSAGASYGNGLALFAYGAYAGSGTRTAMNVSNKVNSSGVLQSDSTGAGTARYSLAAASYGGDKIVFGFGYSGSSILDTLSLADNTGTIVSETSGAGTARASLAAASYGGDKAIFGFGNTTGQVNFITLIGNTGTIVSEVTNYSSSSVFSKDTLAAASYGGDKAIFAFGFTTGNVSSKNLVDNTGSVASTVSSTGFARHGLAAVGYGGDKAVFGFGATTNYQSMTNTVTNAGVVSGDTTNTGYIGRESISGAGYSAA